MSTAGAAQGEQQPLIDRKVDARTSVTADGKKADELLDKHTK
jgi:hypothetical protein